MDKRQLDMPLYNPSYFKQIIYHAYIFQVFSVTQLLLKQKSSFLNHIGKAHKLKYISELHASQSNIFLSKYHVMYQIIWCQAQKAITLIARRELIIPNH